MGSFLEGQPKSSMDGKSTSLYEWRERSKSRTPVDEQLKPPTWSSEEEGLLPRSTDTRYVGFSPLCRSGSPDQNKPEEELDQIGPTQIGMDQADPN